MRSSTLGTPNLRARTLLPNLGGFYTVCMYSTKASNHPEPLGPLELFAYDVQGKVPAGFPSPAEDLGAKRIDVLEHLIKHPQATYQMVIKGDSMRDEGIFDGDVILVDRAISPRSGHIVVAVVDGEFVCKKLYIRAGRMRLKAANPTYADIIPKDGQTVEVWGVVLTAFKKFSL